MSYSKRPTLSEMGLFDQTYDITGTKLVKRKQVKGKKGKSRLARATQRSALRGRGKYFTKKSTSIKQGGNIIKGIIDFIASLFGKKKGYTVPSGFQGLGKKGGALKLAGMGQLSEAEQKTIMKTLKMIEKKGQEGTGKMNKALIKRMQKIMTKYKGGALGLAGRGRKRKGGFGTSEGAKKNPLLTKSGAAGNPWVRHLKKTHMQFKHSGKTFKQINVIAKQTYKKKKKKGRGRPRKKRKKGGQKRMVMDIV